MFLLQAADVEEVQLTEQGRDNRPPLRVSVPSGPLQPANEGRTPLSSLGGAPSQALTPLDESVPRSDTALFYNGIFRSSFRRGLSGLSPVLQLPWPSAFRSLIALARGRGGCPSKEGGRGRGCS